MDFEKGIEGFFKAPSEALEKTMAFWRKEERELISKKPFKLAEKYFSTLGPGLVTGAADDDPSGIATYSQAGAQFGFQLLWLSLFTFPFMAIVQEMCARIGIVTGQGLAANIRKHYPRYVLYGVCALLFLANTLNIAADLGAMAASTRLLLPQINALVLVVAYALVCVLLQIFTTYARYASYLKYLTLALLSYVFTAFAVGLNWSDAAYHTVVPELSFTKDQLFLLCAILGTTISPYLFFWQTSQEVEEKHQHDVNLRAQHQTVERGAAVLKEEIKKMRVDVWSGMFVSNLVMFFIMAACAATLYAHGITNIATADQAALAIKPFGGELTYFFFAVGIIGTGLLAIPILAGSSAYAIAEAFGWKRGLYNTLTQAHAFYGVIIISMVVGVLANFLHLDPIKGLIYAAVANGLVAPVVIFFIIRLSCNLKGHKNHPVITALGWGITGLMAISGIFAIASLII